MFETATAEAPVKKGRFKFCAVCGKELPNAPTTDYVHYSCLAANDPFKGL